MRFVLCALLCAAAGCGTPKPRGSEAGGARKAAVVVVLPDVATLEHAITTLAPLGGKQLGELLPAVGGKRWTTAELAERGLDADAPLGGALTIDGVAIRWVNVRDPDKLTATIDAVPGAKRWSSGSAALWNTGEEIVVLADKRAAFFAGGAASRRERAALELAAGALDVTAAPAPRTIAVEADGSFLIQTFVPGEPVPLLAQLGADLGRVRATVAASAGRIDATFDARPKPKTLAARLLAGARGVGTLVPDGPFAIATTLAPAETFRVLEAIGQRAGMNVAGLAQIAPGSARALHGAIALAPGAVAVRFVDWDSATVAMRGAPERMFIDGSQMANTVVFGSRFSGTGAGVFFVPAWYVPSPLPADPAPIPPIQDENTDVPWSKDYRQARADFEAAVREVASRISVRDSALGQAIFKWREAFGRPLQIAIGEDHGRFHGAGTWKPPAGTIAGTVELAGRELASLAPYGEEIDRAVIAAKAARERALQIRARDVAAWDRR